jgi:hypothetical protein
MAKNDLVLLDGILDEYLSKGLPSNKTDEVFEYFATEQILKDYAFTKEQILSGSVDGRNDGGIDEFFVLVNGHLAERIPEDYWPKSNAELEVYIITCKHDASFKQAPITTMIPSLMELFDFTIPSANLTASYNEHLLRKRDLLISTYRRLATALVKFNMNIVYSCRGDEIIESNIQTKANQAETICQEFFSDCTATFSFWGNSKLLAKYREQPNNTLELKYEHCINQDGQYIVLAKLRDYCKFISDSKGNLNRHLFDSNVRDYLGLNPVNIDILKSLKEAEGPNFWWMNNGITIIGTHAHIVGSGIPIQNVQIVNGLQTSESIFSYFKEGGGETEQRSLLVKILITNDTNTRNAIIYATNNQTNVNVTALRATDKIQQDIEDALKLHGIYYNRRTNHYKNQGMPEGAIIDPLALAAGYVCLMYKNPYKATSIKQRFMRDDLKYEQVFSPTTDLNVWYPIAFLLKKTDLLLEELKPNVGPKSARFLKNYRHIVMFITVSRLMGTFAFGEKQLIAFDLDTYTREELQATIADLNEVNPNCFNATKKLSAAFYTASFRHVADKYNIKAIQAIEAKNREMWSGEIMLSSYALTEKIIEKVFTALPKQPWPAKIHKQVAENLKLREMVVSNAISYLIYIGRLCDQVYGYVFDSDGNIVAEGEHFGHSEEDARKKLEDQKSTREQKFGVNSF